MQFGNPASAGAVAAPGRRSRLAAALAAGALWLAAALAIGPAADALAQQAPAQDGVTVGERSRVARLVSAEKLEREASDRYREILREAASKRALAANDHPQLKRLRAIAQRIVPHAARLNERAPQWRWEVNLIASRQVNAFCMPGGKIAFFSGILETLELNDDEVAAVMAHEIAHALREHGRERAAKSAIAAGVTIGASILSQLMGYGDLGGQLASAGAQFTLLKFSRGDETEADLVGMDLAARAGFDPRAGISLWQKMSAVSTKQPPEWFSTHPSHASRIDEIRRNVDKTLPLYAQATGRRVESLPPYR
ncbi:MAG TPA: M48 family metallopeptidase [Burkholderiaceae bacterium]